MHLKKIHNIHTVRKYHKNQQIINDKSEKLLSDYKHCTSLDGGMNLLQIANQKALKVRQILKDCNIPDPVSVVSPSFKELLYDWFLN